MTLTQKLALLATLVHNDRQSGFNKGRANIEVQVWSDSDEVAINTGAVLIGKGQDLEKLVDQLIHNYSIKFKARVEEMVERHQKDLDWAVALMQ